MNLYYAFVAGIIFTIAVEFLLAWFFSWWSKREVSKADSVVQKYGSQPWANAPGKPDNSQNLQKIEDYIKMKFANNSSTQPSEG